jgi:DNA-binding response OmpR family regulator
VLQSKRFIVVYYKEEYIEHSASSSHKEFSVPLKILVVEDNTDTRLLLHQYFTNAGYLVPTAVDGEKGIYMAKAEQPDLIIADIAMPNMDGKEMIKHIRSEPATAKIPIIVFTAVGNLNADEVLEILADKIFFKPFDFDDLRQVVKEMLHQGNDKGMSCSVTKNC